MNLKTYNLLLFIIHLILAVSFSIYFVKINTKYKNDPVKGLDFSLRDHELDINKNNGKIEVSWESVEKTVISVKNLQVFIILFFLITAIFHLYYYLTSETTYKHMIETSNNYIRWIEYSISSTIMLLIIALSSGVKDINIYALLMVTNIAMISQGQLVEKAVSEGKSWIVPMITGFALLIGEFVIIINSFNTRVREVDNFLKKNPKDGYSRIPKWLYYMIFVLFAFYSCFGFISLWGAYSKIKYENVEKMYLLFSLLSKATLGAFLAYGLGQRQK
jgi:hypothetical protein